MNKLLILKTILLCSILLVILTGCQRMNEVKDDFFNQFQNDEEEIIIIWNDKPKLSEQDDSVEQEIYIGESTIDRGEFYKENNEGHSIMYSSPYEQELEEISSSIEVKRGMTFEELEEQYQSFLSLETQEEETSTFDYSIVSEGEISSIEESLEVEESVKEQPVEEIKQTPIFILDSDMCSDIDDLFALSVLIGYERIGLIDLQGVSLCSSRVRTVYASSALLQASKVYDVPIALHVETGIDMHSDYINEISNLPHSENYVGDNLQLYNEIFFKNTQKVNIVCTGQLVQLQRLLHQPNGAEIIRQNVDKLYFVGTKYTGKPENNLWYGADKYNGKMGAISVDVIANWPTEIVFIPADTGGLMSVGYFFNNSDRNKTDIITQAMSYFNGGVSQITAFDPFGVFVSVMDANGLNEQHGLIYEIGHMGIHESGGSWWEDNPTGTHRRVRLLNDNSYYQGQMNAILGSEFTVRTGKEVQW